MLVESSGASGRRPTTAHYARVAEFRAIPCGALCVNKMITERYCATCVHKRTEAAPNSRRRFLLVTLVGGFIARVVHSMAAMSHLKARKAAKMREIGEALVAVGYVSLDDQATALHLSRSTTWTIIKGTHKGSGLSTAVLNRMLIAPGLHHSCAKESSNTSRKRMLAVLVLYKECLRKFNERFSGCSTQLDLVDPV